MIDKTINDDKTIASCGKDMILVGRYHVLCKEGHGSTAAMKRSA